MNSTYGSCAPRLASPAVTIPESNERQVLLVLIPLGVMVIDDGMKIAQWWSLTWPSERPSGTQIGSDDTMTEKHGTLYTIKGGRHLSPSELGALEMHFSLVPIHRGRPDWNCQTWVVEALRGLNQSYMYAVQMGYAQWFQQMGIVERAWDVGLGDA
ncbi:hypothetical protein JVT61DRAFT_10041 [Boletus reticuloceps]|uniref:Uncharacterized protein n=1 Tax=Boletus reticuloceps TaxID=495285 RepID=A0A8I2YXJ1_9AGAM|nr:hypothetical protein JVT61DRAFT_10041 [Boletus reticuloceps]